MKENTTAKTTEKKVYTEEQIKAANIRRAIYAHTKKKHPEYSQKRLYTTTNYLYNKQLEKAAARAAAEAEEAPAEAVAEA